MDPISIAVTILAIYGILHRSPSLAGEAVREFGYARRGEESPAAATRRQRLIDAGIDPAAGGAMRQFIGNAWRDFWLDKDSQRKMARARRGVAEANGDAESWWDRMSERLDDEVTRRADRFRSRPTEDHRPVLAHADDDDPPRSEPGYSPDTPPHSPPSPPGSDTFDAPDPDQDEPRTPDLGAVHNDQDYRDPGPNRSPIRVTATLGEPLDRPTAPTTHAPAITAGGTMTAVATTQQNVTGVASGAAEARAIQRQIDAATGEYVAQLARIRARIHALGESTLGTVQMSGRSRVVALTQQAAESAAAAQSMAKGCGAEVAPLLGHVAREFNRISS